MVTLTLDDRLLAAYLFYGSILMLKTWAMSFFTARHRIQNKALPSPEDYGAKNKDRPVRLNDDVERVRRAHHNDLENIPIFMIVALLYMFSNLPVMRCLWCLRVFTAARILHTVAYLNAFSHPRGLGFGVGALCTAILGVSVLYSAVGAGVF
ncbi:Microsomal glutathione S-transferase 1 [Desmophyllum pertusum]|uniref:Microsomal glutathione S-transferase 1 n=1 Tax=Desmophyllum pertusum TaxID=174260 RepID=A0A9W9YPT7_9CNID|nr:Microsomal glutathione S-transferase 1 [Desmophyllum pertusum]